MHFRSNATSYAATFIIFDPAAVPAELVRDADFDQTICVLSSDGRGLVARPASGYVCEFLILVDETPDDRFQQHRAHGITGAVLRVPSGCLLAIAYEDLSRKYRSDTFQPGPGQAAEVPAGNYHMEAFDLRWGEIVENEVTRRASRGDLRIETVVNFLLSAAVVSTIFVAPVACVVTWIIWNWREAMMVSSFFLISSFAIWGHVTEFIGTSNSCRRMQDLRDAVKREFPDVVIVLRRCAESELPTTITPGKFGAGC